MIDVLGRLAVDTSFGQSSMRMGGRLGLENIRGMPMSRVFLLAHSSKGRDDSPELLEITVSLDLC
jgi:hypothetical protein